MPVYGPLSTIKSYLADRPMHIEGRLKYVRERLTGMTQDERAWRKKWLKDQELAPREPKYVKRLDRYFQNPIKLAYKVPIEWFFYGVLSPRIGQHAAYTLRQVIPKGLLIYLSVCTVWYYYKYNAQSWEWRHGPQWKIYKPTLYPGDPGFPFKIHLEPDDMQSLGFKERTVHVNPIAPTSTSLDLQ